MSIKSKIFFIFLTIILILGVQLLANAPIVSEQKELVAPDGNIDWTRYYNSDEMLTIMKELERRYPKLAKVYVIGKSYLGKDLHLMEITNRDKKPALEKPGIYIDGNMHTGEQTGAMLTLYMIWHLLTNYGKDAQATYLVDNCTFYLRPKFEVDASDWWLANPGDTDYGGSVRPRDNDLDGEADEDPPDDLNGDGHITKMRIKDPNGEWKISDKDTRVMEKRKENESGGIYYRILTEGIDNDGDGLFNEDGIGGINLSHNFSWGNMNREQIQSSPYTFSEPETRATVEFWENHPNIYVMVDLHTYGSFDELLYFPGGEDMPAKDLAAYKYLTAAYAHFTDREEVLSMMKTFPQPIWKLGMGDPEPFAYYNMGMFGWCEELWGGDYANPALRKYDKNKDKKITEDEILDFLDKEVEGKGFVEWKPFNHPQLGLVEIGGLVEKFTVQNPPHKLLGQELKFKLPWYLYLAETAPRVKIKDIKVSHLDGKAVSLKAIVENVGFLPTNVTEWAVKVGLAKPVVVKIELKNAVLLEGKERISLGNISGNQDRGEKAEWGLLPAFEGFPDNKRDAMWIIKLTGEEAEAIVTVISEKAGADSKKIPLK